MSWSTFYVTVPQNHAKPPWSVHRVAHGLEKHMRVPCTPCGTHNYAVKTHPTAEFSGCMRIMHHTSRSSRAGHCSVGLSRLLQLRCRQDRITAYWELQYWDSGHSGLLRVTCDGWVGITAILDCRRVLSRAVNLRQVSERLGRQGVLLLRLRMLLRDQAIIAEA